MRIKDIRKCDMCETQFDYLKSFRNSEDVPADSYGVHITEFYPDPPFSFSVHDLCDECMREIIEFIKQKQKEYGTR
jgi:hypothetical protein